MIIKTIYYIFWECCMILTGPEIKKQVLKNRIHIKPFNENNLNPNSYNYHFDTNLLEITDYPIDPKKCSSFRKLEFNKDGYILLPNRVYLGNTFEEIGSDHYVTTLIGRSSMGRLGLFLQITADLGHLGAKHRWTLEMKVVQPLRIYPMMSIGQVSFWCTSGNREQMYRGKYAKYSAAHISEIYKETFY